MQGKEEGENPYVLKINQCQPERKVPIKHLSSPAGAEKLGAKEIYLI